MKCIYFLFLLSFFFAACNEENEKIYTSILAEGQMPNIAKDSNGSLHIVYGKADSIMYSISNNNEKSFTAPVLVSILPNLAASHSRGPQIAISNNGITVIACNTLGDILSFTKNKSGQWQPMARVNDMDTVAKEGLMALSGNKDFLFAVWLDLRDKHNKIVGSSSVDGGKTWSENKVIYASPDTTVCECCKPSVVIKENTVYVMFRNWLGGNRDMYLIKSSDHANTFGEAKKLGNGSWALNGCPMDGGGLTINNNSIPQTIWRREGKIYACEPGKAELEIAEGKNGSVEFVNGKNVYAWAEKGEIIVRNSTGMKKNLGKGQLPLIKGVNNEHIICVWEHEKKIHTALIKI